MTTREALEAAENEVLVYEAFGEYQADLDDLRADDTDEPEEEDDSESA